MKKWESVQCLKVWVDVKEEEQEVPDLELAQAAEFQLRKQSQSRTSNLRLKLIEW